MVEKLGERKRILYGRTIRVRTYPQSTYVVVNRNESGKMWEVFIRVGKSGGEINGLSQGLGIVISCTLRNGTDPREIARHLKGIHGENPRWDADFPGSPILGVADAVGRAMEKDIEIIESAIDNKREESNDNVVDSGNSVDGDSNICVVDSTVKGGSKNVIGYDYQE